MISSSMESNTKLNPQSLQNPHDFDWLHEDLFLFDNVLDELPPLEIDGFLEVNSHSLPFHLENNILELETEILEMRMVKLEDDDKGIKELQEVTKMIEKSGFSSSWKEEEEKVCEERLRLLRNGKGRKRSSVLGLEEIQKHFHIPISEAAKQMNVGLTVLKRRCRQLNIMRWPHRKLKSLTSLIENVKEMGLTNEVKGLEEHKRLVEALPNMDLTHTTKRLRQACFKANYKKNRRIRSNNIATLHH